MHSLKLFAFVAACAVGACKTQSGSPPQPTQNAPSTGSHDETRTLALAPSDGKSGADRFLAVARERVETHPDRTDSWIALGQAWVQKARDAGDPGYYLHADACAQVVLEQDENDRLALDLRGLVLLNAHAFEDARKVAEQALARYPDDAPAYGTLSDALLELGDFERAAAAAQAMVDLKPNLPSYERAAYIRWLQGDLRGAKRFFALAIDAGKGARDREPLAWVLVQAASMFAGERDLAGAEAGYDRALEVFPEYPPALAGKARIALARGDSRGAADLAARSYAARPLPETAWLLGDAREAAGDTAGSVDAYAHVLADGHRGDRRTLARFLSTKNYDAAEALRLADAERSIRGDIQTEDVRAWALYRNGRISEARTAMVRARRLGTRDARLLFHDGAIRVALGDRQGGRKLVREALALNLDPGEVSEAKQLLKKP